MKKLGITGISKLLGSLGLVAVLSTSLAGNSVLAGIELGSEYKEGCEKLKGLFAKKEPKYTFKISKDRCGYEFGNWVGLKTKDGTTVDYIGIRHTIFGYPFYNEAKDIAQDYIKNINAVSHMLDFDPKNNWYIGTNLLGTERVTIDYFVIAISKVENKSNNFDIK